MKSEIHKSNYSENLHDKNSEQVLTDEGEQTNKDLETKDLENIEIQLDQSENQIVEKLDAASLFQKTSRFSVSPIIVQSIEDEAKIDEVQMFEFQVHSGEKEQNEPSNVHSSEGN